MKFNEFTTEGEKTRLDSKCWTGKKIGNPKTKVKGGVRVNNCVPAESVAEGEKKLHPETWHDVDKKLGKAVDKMSQTEKVKKGLAHPDTLKKQGVAEGSIGDKIKGAAKSVKRAAQGWGVGGELDMPTAGGVVASASKLRGDADDRTVPSLPGAVLGFREHPPKNKAQEFAKRVHDREMRQRGYGRFVDKDEQGVAEGANDTIYPNAEIIKSKNGKPVGEIYQDGNSWGAFHYRADRGYDFIDSREEAIEALKDLHQETGRSRPDYTVKGMAEGSNPEYDDEAGMADNNLETLKRTVQGIDDLIGAGDNLPEWCQEKIAVAKSMLVAVWDYMESEDNEEEDPEVAEMYEAMESLVEEIAARDRVDVDLVWESFESLDDHMLYETAAWRRKEGKSKSGGLNAKGVASYRRENPGSKLQTAVTTKPSKLKKGSKAAKRRKSFCARMSGVKGPMKKPNGKPTRKALALRKWNC